jgi:hypothetical protein
VTVRNDGTDRARGDQFDVTVGLSTRESSFPEPFSTVVSNPEQARLQPGASIDVPLQVVFPCGTTVYVRADVDTARQIINNTHSFPPYTTSVNPTLVPWLKTTLKVGLQDSAGTITYDPAALCYNKILVADVEIANEGCALAPQSETWVTVEDPSAPVGGGTLATFPIKTPPIMAGGVFATRIPTRTPPAVPAAPAAITVRACADVTTKVLDQCDRHSLCALWTAPLAGGIAPSASLVVGGNGFVRPGEAPTLTWSAQNDCADIGVATVRVLHGTPPTAIWTATNMPIGLRSRVGGEIAARDITIDSSIANAFWAIGAHVLTLEIVGSGSDPGPYRATTTLDVRPEPVDATWWTWSGIGGRMAFWKTSYTIFGTFTNRGVAPMTMTSLAAIEHPTDVVGTGSDLTLRPFAGTPAGSTPPAALGGRWTMNQAWTWLTPVYFTEVGPRSRTFTYAAAFDLVDAFGNAYPGIVSRTTSMSVEIRASKLNYHDGAVTFITTGLATLAISAMCAIEFPVWPAVLVCIGIAAVGMAEIIAGTVLGYLAMDPPVPDFRGSLPDRMPLRWAFPECERGTPADLAFTLASLLDRIIGATQQARQARARAWGAHIDGDESALDAMRRAAWDAVEAMRRAADGLANVVDELEPSWQEMRARFLDQASGTRSGAGLDKPAMLARIREHAERLNVSEQHLATVERVLDGASTEQIERAMRDPASGSLLVVTDATRRWCEVLAAELREYDFMRQPAP